AGQRVEEELDGRVLFTWASPNADEEVHRQQHDLPEDIEEEEVERAEDAHHPRFEEEEHREEALHVLVDVPRGTDGDRRNERRQEHHEDRNAVDTEEILDIEATHPWDLLYELKSVVTAAHGHVAVEFHEQHDGERERNQRENERRHLDLVILP